MDHEDSQEMAGTILRFERGRFVFPLETGI